MQAVVCRQFGPTEALVIEERPRPVPGPGQVLVEVHAAGVNFTDLLAIEGRSQLKRQLPMIPGVEAAGVTASMTVRYALQDRAKLRPGETLLVLGAGGGAGLAGVEVGTYAEPAMRVLGWQGRYLSVGVAAGVPKIALGPALFKNADIMGIQPSSDEYRLPGRSPAATQTLFGWYQQGKLRPLITQVLPLSRAAEALRSIAQRQATGRIVLMTSRA